MLGLAEDYECQENGHVSKDDHSDVDQALCFIVELRQSGSFAPIHMRSRFCAPRAYKAIEFEKTTG